MQKGNLALVEGTNPVLELIKSKRYIKKVYIDRNLKSAKGSLISKLCSDQGVSVEFCDRSSLDSLSQTKSHQGVIALAEPIKFDTLKNFLKHSDDPNLSFVLLRNLTYEHNLGAIIRTSVASGVSGIVLPKSSSLRITPVVERTSMGAVNEARIFKDSFFSALKTLKKFGFKVVALEVTGKKYYFEEDLTGRIAFVAGGESETLSNSLINKVDSVIKMPMMSKVPSLNVSVALGIALYDRIRQLYGNTI